LKTDFETEHGLSVYLEADNYNCLLDVGASDLFARNAKLMNIDLGDVDYLFISHGHADHIGGLPAFLEINEKAKIVLYSDLCTGSFTPPGARLRKISIDFDFDTIKDRLITVKDSALLEGDISVFRGQHCKIPIAKGQPNALYKQQ